MMDYNRQTDRGGEEWNRRDKGKGGNGGKATPRKGVAT